MPGQQKSIGVWIHRIFAMFNNIMLVASNKSITYTKFWYSGLHTSKVIRNPVMSAYFLELVWCHRLFVGQVEIKSFKLNVLRSKILHIFKKFLSAFLKLWDDTKNKNKIVWGEILWLFMRLVFSEHFVWNWFLEIRDMNIWVRKKFVFGSNFANCLLEYLKIHLPS